MNVITSKFAPFRGKNPFIKGLRIGGMVVFGIIAAAVFALVFGVFVMLLWNWLIPLIFGLTTITYWQAFGIVILAKLIFGAVGHGREDWHDKFSSHDKWKKWGPCGGEWDMMKDRHSWEYYHDFWRDEGKTAFASYIKKQKTEEEKQKNE